MSIYLSANRFDFENVIKSINDDSLFNSIPPAVMGLITARVSLLGLRFMKKIIQSDWPAIKRQRYARRKLISRLRLPSRSKFQGRNKCFRQRWAA